MWRIGWRRWIRSVVTAGVALFVLANVLAMTRRVSPVAPTRPPSWQVAQEYHRNLNSDDVGNNSLQALLNRSKVPVEAALPPVNPRPKDDTPKVDGPPAVDETPTDWPTTVLRDEDEAILRLIKRINSRQTVYNPPPGGLALQNDTAAVVVIQVHNRLKYLKQLLDSLRKAKNIDKALLIFSHDYYDENLFRLIHTVNFCPYMQIFYPYPMQVYRDQFPGQSPGDCSRNDKPEQAKARKCLNAEYPDKYGHFREAAITQTKHHWFWKLQRVFRELPLLQSYNGMVVLLEEDHYATPDFLHVLRMLNHQRHEKHGDATIITLGNYDKAPNFPVNGEKYDKGMWIASKHNMGMAIDRAGFDKINACSKEFCTFDDYNWDWTLQFVGQNCVPGGLKVLVVKAPRVFHNGECGVHHKKTCDSANENKRISFIRNILQTNVHKLYPVTMNVFNAGLPRVKSTKPNGGWGDIRDRQLCHIFINTTEPLRLSAFSRIPPRRP